MTARDVVLDRFAWVDGRADVWAVFRDAAALRTVVTALVEPFADDRITAACGIGSRGFLLGGGCAVRLGVGGLPGCRQCAAGAAWRAVVR